MAMYSTSCSRPLWPASATVGTSGASVLRWRLVTASAVTLPAFTCGSRPGVASTPPLTSPLRMAVTAGVLPLYGTWVMFMPVASWNSSAARWPGLPAPAELKVTPLPLPAATRSAMVLKPVDGCAPTSRPDEAITMMGRKSAGLNGMPL